MSSPMDAYLRDTGVEMQTYSRNGTRVQTRENEALVRALLLAYIARSSAGQISKQTNRK